MPTSRAPQHTPVGRHTCECATCCFERGGYAPWGASCWGREDEGGLVRGLEPALEGVWRAQGSGVCSRLGAVRERGYSDDRAVLFTQEAGETVVITSQAGGDVADVGVVVSTLAWV